MHASQGNRVPQTKRMSEVSPYAQNFLIGYSALYLLNAIYCCYESISLLVVPCKKGDFSSGSSQRGFFILLFLLGNITRFAWLIFYSSSNVVVEAPDSTGIYNITCFLREVPELFFLAAYSFLGAYFGQVCFVFIYRSFMIIFMVM